jgi:indolepyruvate ferredoxin oxidoreductase, beta subunit
MKDINILIVGVGGQGVIVASDTVAEIGMNNGYDVKKSDSIGMSQRGGSVVSHVRWGEKVFSPMNKQGEVDYLLGFEKLETARSVDYLKPGGIAIIADVKVPPVSLISSKLSYPGDDEINEIIKKYTTKIYMIPATKICVEAGNTRALNMVMIGALSVFLGLKEEVWNEDIRSRLRSGFISSSLKAFSLGADAARKLK